MDITVTSMGKGNNISQITGIGKPQDLIEAIAKDPRIIEQVHRDAPLSETICKRVLDRLVDNYFLDSIYIIKCIANQGGGE